MLLFVYNYMSVDPKGNNIKENPAYNRVRKVRESLLISKAELASRAGVSTLTVSRVEKGLPCRMDTKRKILLALGQDLSERSRIFPAG